MITYILLFLNKTEEKFFNFFPHDNLYPLLR